MRIHVHAQRISSRMKAVRLSAHHALELLHQPLPVRLKGSQSVPLSFQRRAS